jgi:urease accessory protein
MLDDLSSRSDPSAVETVDEMWIALQVCDSSFPGGSFAHSLGLESALQHKLVNSASSSLDSFVSMTLEQANAQLIPLVSAAHHEYYAEYQNSSFQDSRLAYSLEALLRIDELCHISLTNEVARRSSINQGMYYSYTFVMNFSTKFNKMKQHG